MTTVSAQNITNAVTVLADTFNRETSKPLYGGYRIALCDLTDSELAVAVRRALAECRFMPAPAELLTFAGRKPRDVGAEATLAWDAVRRALDVLDVYGNPDFGPLVNAVIVNLGGWLYLCEQKLSELEWRRKDFERVYKLWAEKPAHELPDGAPLMGQWRHAPVTRVEIPGVPQQPRGLPPIETPHSKAVSTIVRELAESKSTAKEFDIPARPDGAPPVPPRPEKPKAPPMTDAEVAARKEQIRQQMAARGVMMPTSGDAPTEAA